MFEQFDADRCLPHFTIKMYYDGCFEDGNYVGGTFGFIDFCQEDEMGIMEICAMAKELSGGFSNDYYLRLNGRISIIKSDTDALRMCQLVDSNRLVEVYAVSNIVVLPTQCSQVGSGSASANQTKRKEKPTIDIGVDCNAKGKDTCLMVEEEDEDTDDYDPESESSAESEYEEFEDSDCAIEEDDELFDINVDMEAEYGGVGDQTMAHDEHADLADLDDTSDDSDELVSLSSESDSDGGGKKQKNKYPVFNEHADMLNPVFSVGMEFKTHEVFRDAVKEHAIKFGKKIKFVKNEKQKVSGICLAKGCPWYIYASFVKGGGVFRIKHYIANHSCSREYNVPHVSTKWIVKRYGERIGKNPTWPIQSLADTIESEWTVHVDRQKVFRAKRRALAILEGTATEQFGMLMGYIDEVRANNLGSTIKIKCKPVDGSDNEVKFKRLYICWGSLKTGFVEGCRPVIGLDGCHLKGPHGGILLTAVGVDANNCIYPFAYAVVGKEKKKTWQWFLELLKEDLNVHNTHVYTFMTDKQKGLLDAVAEVFPNAGHRFCVRHLYNNFKGEFKGLHLKEILWKAARATTVPAFTKAMSEMKNVDKNAFDWLNARPPVNWSRSHFDTFPKCDILLNNLCESFNSAILPARDKPIITMLERIITILMESNQKRRNAMMRCTDPICPKVKKRLNKLRDERGWIPRYFGNDKFQVEGPNEQYRVDLKNKTCGCRRWELSGIPCVHAIAAYNKLNRDPMAHVHDCYNVRTYLSIYSNVLGPINGRHMWDSSGHPKLLPPDVKKRSGRPKKVRRREPDEVVTGQTTFTKKGVKMTCSGCGKTGHNKRGCKGKGKGTSAAAGEVNATAGEVNVVGEGNAVGRELNAGTPTTGVGRGAGGPSRGARGRGRGARGAGRGAATDRNSPLNANEKSGITNVVTEIAVGSQTSVMNVATREGSGVNTREQLQNMCNHTSNQAQPLMWRGKRVFLASSLKAGAPSRNAAK